MKKTVFCAVAFVVFAFAMLGAVQKPYAQQIPRFNPDTVLTFKLEQDAVVKVGKAGLDVEDFIHQIVTDTSFYEAFRLMKKYHFTAENQIYTYNKKNKITGSIKRKLQHSPAGQHLKILEERSSGNLRKKNGDYQLKTLDLFDHLFMGAYQSGYSPNTNTGAKPESKNDGYKEKLKTLIFSPGRPVKGIPLISGKTEIFTPNMRQYYDYAFAKGMYLDSIPVYRFKVTVKPDLGSWTEDGIMIKELTTIFDQRNFQILGRYIDMKLNNLAFDFDVQMNIEMSYFNEELLPTKVSYQGNWNVPFKKEERASFLVLHKNYRL
ncbi:hypothetical protein BCY91_01540 [Pelobium manganitolerans]|uniref:Uncharacterized protein n=1 Tax=Pelobium manganitolerans TaxID=1842495 RepID=A0A419SBZ1_9SPHI|nr:hypothetical protein [Pelobium manganitolerans]RKD20328.1 hypothetical protein BCY91_01540 [Pelobium manganitolerans]